MQKNKDSKILKHFTPNSVGVVSYSKRGATPYRTRSFAKGTSAGFTLFFAVLTASLLLSIGVSMLNISLKELDLSASGRESQFAFYAADTGLECALYWDRVERSFATSTDSSVPSSGIICNGQDITQSDAWNNSNIDNNSATTVFSLLIDQNDPQKGCAVVEVTKEQNGNQVETVLESRGRNNCGTAGDKFERGIMANY